MILAGGLTPENVAAAIARGPPCGGRRDQLAGGREPPQAPRARRRVSRRGACGVTPAPRQGPAGTLKRVGPSSAAGPTLRSRLVRGLGLAALLAAVGIAFADSSIVVLALPELLTQFDGSITQVAWVVTAYNLVLAVAAFVLVRVGPRFAPGRMALVGGGVFLAASLACAAAPELWSLNAFRAVQGLGAALLLLGALPLARRLAASPERGSALWTGAGVLGAALGPALGGVLTELLGWRSIFLVQAPFAALVVVVALVLGRSGGETAPAAAGAPGSDPGGARRRRAAGAALALASAALVGLLFLAVVMLVDVWRLSPLGAGLVVTTIPLATLAAAPFLSARASGRRAGAGAGERRCHPARRRARRHGVPACPQPGLGGRRARDRRLRLRPPGSERRPGGAGRARLAGLERCDVAGAAPCRARCRAGRADAAPHRRPGRPRGTRPSCAGSRSCSTHPCRPGTSCGSRSTSRPCSPRRRARACRTSVLRSRASPEAQSPASGVSSMRR